MKNRDESEQVSSPAPQGSRPLEFSRDGGKTWEVVGWMGENCFAATLDGVTLGVDMAEPEPRPLNWITINDPGAVVKMTTKDAP